MTTLKDVEPAPPHEFATGEKATLLNRVFNLESQVGQLTHRAETAEARALRAEIKLQAIAALAFGR